MLGLRRFGSFQTLNYLFIDFKLRLDFFFQIHYEEQNITFSEQKLGFYSLYYLK